jgi:hypothetical protein
MIYMSLLDGLAGKGRLLNAFANELAAASFATYKLRGSPVFGNQSTFICKAGSAQGYNVVTEAQENLRLTRGK